MSIHAPGARIAGRYEIAGRPLMGGMGIVYLCFDHQEERPVALKTFKPEYLPNRAARDRFLREGTTWVNLGRHPHIVRAYGVERIGDGREVYLVLELVAKEEGRADASLRSWLSPGKPLPVEQALLFALQITRGMAHATELIPGFVHRDLKPENVLVGADRLSSIGINRLRVSDFGLAAVLEASSLQLAADEREEKPEIQGSAGNLGRTQLTHGIVGTPVYMAPEQWKGEGICVQTDVYALGCILYEMLAGKQAVEGDSLAVLERAHRAGKVQSLDPGLPGTVREMVARCLAQEPAARYGSWGEMEAVLGAAYAEVTGRAVPMPEPVQTLNRAERVARGWSYNAMGASYLDIGRPEMALAHFEQARDVGQMEGEHRLEAAGLGNLGLAYADQGDARPAIACYRQAMAIARKIDDRHSEGEILGNLGNAYADLGDARRAVRYHGQALLISREIGDRRGEGAALGNLGNAYRELGDIRRAVGYFEQALSVIQQIGNRRAEGAILGNLGNTYYQLGDAQRAIEFHKQSLAIAREIGDWVSEGNTLSNLGLVYRALGDVRRAIECYEQSLPIAREVGDRRGEGAALGNLGTAYADLGDVRRAIECYGQSLAIRREIDDVAGVATDSFNLALLHQRQGEPERALFLAQQAAETWDRVGSPYAQQAQQLVADIQAVLR